MLDGLAVDPYRGVGVDDDLAGEVRARRVFGGGLAPPLRQRQQGHPAAAEAGPHRLSHVVALKSRTTRTRAARARRSAVLAFRYTARISAASATGSSGATSAASAGDTTSGTPPTRVAMMGLPAAIASNRTMG